MKKRWGSCNYKKKILIFNKNLEYLPEELIKHIVIHEMCHLIVKNHNKEFWALVSKLDPDFKEKRKLLAGYMVKFLKGRGV
jgi:predicted metal-dependent hydrolase